jgi:hypothetical protein
MEDAASNHHAHPRCRQVEAPFRDRSRPMAAGHGRDRRDLADSGWRTASPVPICRAEWMERIILISAGNPVLQGREEGVAGI